MLNEQRYSLNQVINALGSVGMSSHNWIYVRKRLAFIYNSTSHCPTKEGEPFARWCVYRQAETWWRTRDCVRLDEI